MKKFQKYKTNLSYDTEWVYSYKTRVAKIDTPYLVKLGYWSVTTSKHINYAARELGLTVIEAEE